VKWNLPFLFDGFPLTFQRFGPSLTFLGVLFCLAPNCSHKYIVLFIRFSSRWSVLSISLCEPPSETVSKKTYPQFLSALKRQRRLWLALLLRCLEHLISPRREVIRKSFFLFRVFVCADISALSAVDRILPGWKRFFWFLIRPALWSLVYVVSFFLVLRIVDLCGRSPLGS